MTDNTTTRALTATRTIHQLGGLQRATYGGSTTVPVGSDELLRLLGVFAKLHLEVPVEVTDTLEATATIAQRAHTLKVASPVFDKDDLAADDWEVRFTAAMTGRLREMAKADALINAAKTTAINEAAARIRAASPALIGVLNTAYRQHAAAEHRNAGPGIHEAHQTLLGWQPGQPLWKARNDYAADWCILFAWTQDAWNRLATDTRAQMELPGNWTSRYEFAIECGGVPYLTPSVKDTFDRSEAHRHALQNWREEQAAEARQEWAQGQFNDQVAQAEAEHRRAVRKQEAIAAALVAAEAAAAEWTSGPRGVLVTRRGPSAPSPRPSALPFRGGPWAAT